MNKDLFEEKQEIEKARFQNSEEGILAELQESDPEAFKEVMCKIAATKFKEDILKRMNMNHHSYDVYKFEVVKTNGFRLSLKDNLNDRVLTLVVSSVGLECAFSGNIRRFIIRNDGTTDGITPKFGKRLKSKYMPKRIEEAQKHLRELAIWAKQTIEEYVREVHHEPKSILV